MSIRTVAMHVALAAVPVAAVTTAMAQPAGTPTPEGGAPAAPSAATPTTGSGTTAAPATAAPATAAPVTAASGTAAPAAPQAPVPRSTDRGLSWGGRVRFNILLESGFTSGEAGADADLHARTPEISGYFAQAELGLAHDSQEINPKELFVGRGALEGTELRFGFQQKPFGLQDYLEDEQRLSIDKPVVYDKLEEFGYSGREIRVGLVDVDSADDGLDLHATVGSGSATNFNLLLGAGEFSPDAPLHYGAFALAQGQRYRSEREFVWAASAFAGSRAGPFRWNLEAVIGKDPYETEWERTFGRRSSDVLFWSAGAFTGFEAFAGDGWRLLPYLGGSYLVPRQSRAKQNTLQAIAGLRYDAGPVRAAVEADVIGTTKQDKDERSWKRSQGRFELSYAF